MPALTRAFKNCRDNGAPHGLCLTSTPGFLTTECGQYMYDLKNKMTPFSELWYDFTLEQLTGKTKIPDGYYFVMGDNRKHSLDSRDYRIGLVKEEDIIGKPICRIWPLNKIGTV